jgi:FAD/FMN-containing dehydrogenase
LKGVCLAILASWPDPEGDDAHCDWVVTTANALRDSGVGGECGNAVNNSTLVSTDRLRGLFGEENFMRLQGIKAEYDPENVFQWNYNIPPAERRDTK